MIDENDLIEIFKQLIAECDAAVGAIASGCSLPASSSSGAISDIDVIGDCSHPSDGVMGDGCFHIPSNDFTPVTRLKDCCYGGSKRRKDKNGKDKKYSYEKNMKIITSYNDAIKSSKQKK